MSRSLKRQALALCGVLTIVFCACGHLASQEVRATLSGTVSDPQGAAIAGARVEVKNIDTGVVSPATTNESGLYVVPLLPPGNYSVSVTHAGFARAEQPQIELRSNDRRNADFHLAIGTVSQEMIVTAHAPPLLTTEWPIPGVSTYMLCVSVCAASWPKAGGVTGSLALASTRVGTSLVTA